MKLTTNKMLIAGAVGLVVKLAVTAVVVKFAASPAFALDREVELELKRLEQRIVRLQQTNDQLVKDMRAQQRRSDDVSRELDKVLKINTRLEDDFIKLTNIEMLNVNNKIDQLLAVNWGSKERECEGFGKHQQVKVFTKNDMMMRSLCFDGILVHLSTEKLSPPE